MQGIGFGHTLRGQDVCREAIVCVRFRSTICLDRITLHRQLAPWPLTVWQGILGRITLAAFLPSTLPFHKKQERPKALTAQNWLRTPLLRAMPGQIPEPPQREGSFGPESFVTWNTQSASMIRALGQMRASQGSASRSARTCASISTCSSLANWIKSPSRALPVRWTCYLQGKKPVC